MDPTLRFDSTGKSDCLCKIIERAKNAKISDADAALLKKACCQEPWLEWAEKKERSTTEVDTVELHIHERLSAKAILKTAAREDIHPDFFADPQQEVWEAVQFYQHEMDWSNRLILGDSLQVMASLARREHMEGKVQMVYFDPPYGISYNSNFQPEVDERRVKNRGKDFTREIEMVKAYRDTWRLGIHSYLTYLRDRIKAAHELLHDTGSLFIQISDENLSLVSQVANEIFGRNNMVQIITFTKKSHTSKTHSIADYLLWYAKEKGKMKVNDLYRERGKPEESKEFKHVETETGERKRVGSLSDEEKERYKDKFVNQGYPLRSAEPNNSEEFICVEGRRVSCGPNHHWSYPEQGIKRLEQAGRVRATENSAYGVVYWSDFNLGTPSNIWDGLHGDPKRIYVVQTNRKVVERCMWMTTEPGDLVLDPTCGSGTTAYVAEKLGRRWITIDSSRVAIALARKRMLTSVFEYYRLKNKAQGISGGIQNQQISKISLGSIARNIDLDPIFAKHEPRLERALNTCNIALASVDAAFRNKLKTELKAKGARATDADKRSLGLPTTEEGFKRWTVPYELGEEWPQDLKEAVDNYRQAWREKMDEVNECIDRNASQIELIDKPIAESKTSRVSGPFTVEAVFPTEVPPATERETSSGKLEDGDTQSRNASAYIKKIVGLLNGDGVRFPNNEQHRISLTLTSGEAGIIHAVGEWQNDGPLGTKADNKLVAVVCGPQYGPVTATQVKEAIRAATGRKCGALVIAGFNFDGAAQAEIRSPNNPIRVHMAHISPDINPGMEGLLKNPPRSQLFTVFGEPRVAVIGPDGDGFFIVKMEGVDIFDPVKNIVVPSGATKVVAWLLDVDYDGRTFRPSQVFFSSKKAWVEIKRHLRGFVDDEVFDKFTGTESFPFAPGENRTIAVKVIDPRGNEVMSIHKLPKN